jgi:hypothetical protein
MGALPNIGAQMKKYLHTIKTLAILIAFFLASQGAALAWEFAIKQWDLYRREIAASVISQDLDGKDLTVDIKTKQQKIASKLTHDEMQKVIWVLSVQNDQLKSTIDTVKSAIDYHEE